MISARLVDASRISEGFRRFKNDSGEASPESPTVREAVAVAETNRPLGGHSLAGSATSASLPEAFKRPITAEASHPT